MSIGVPVSVEQLKTAVKSKIQELEAGMTETKKQNEECRKKRDAWDKKAAQWLLKNRDIDHVQLYSECCSIQYKTAKSVLEVTLGERPEAPVPNYEEGRQLAELRKVLKVLEMCATGKVSSRVASNVLSIL